MKKYKRYLLFVLGIIAIINIYIFLIMQNVYVYVSNHSWDKKNVEATITFEKVNAEKSHTFSSKTEFKDSITLDQTGNKYDVYRFKATNGSKYKIGVRINEEKALFQDTIDIDIFTFIYVTINSQEKKNHTVTINSYSFKEARELNLLFYQKE